MSVNKDEELLGVEMVMVYENSSGGINAAHVHQSGNNDSGEMRTTSSTGVLQGEPVPAGSLVRVHKLRRMCPSKKKQCSMHCI
ncbi:unnamed protein product [Brassica oleracea var. botrytis]